jgi:hypothetical protein
VKPPAHARIGGILVLCCGAALAAAQAPAPTRASAAPAGASAPEIHVDDTWTYRILDGYTHETQGEVTQRVVEVGESEIVTQLRSTKSDKPRLRYFSRDWNIIDAGELKYDPYFPEYKFPLAVGMSWNGNFTSSGNDGNAYSGYLRAKVAALEKTTVPAGTFDAYRIDIELETRSENANSILTEAQITTWYAPAVRRFVRRQVTASRDGRVRSKSEDVLIEYGKAAAH